MIFVARVFASACAVAFLALPLSAEAAQNIAVRPAFDHVVIIMLENHSDKSIIGDPAAPTLTRYANLYGYASNYYGVTHPSLPNYLAITSGNNWYSNSDDPTQRFDHRNIVDEMEARHVSWKAYMQGLPSAGYGGNFYPSEANATYVIRHDPFMLYDDVRNNARRRAKVVPLTQLSTDIEKGSLPRFMWISPDVCSDMHGTPEEPCPYSKDARLRRTGDDFVALWVPRLMRARDWTPHSVIFILTDETTFTGEKSTGGWLSAAGCCDSPKLPAGTALLSGGGVYGGGKVPLVVIGAMVKPHFRSALPYNHYSLLQTVEDAWHLRRLGMTSDANVISSLATFFRK